MIDLENDIYNYVAQRLRAAHPGVFVAGEYVDIPANFPAVTIVEADNRVYERMRTTRIENAASVMYDVNVYSDKAAGKKTEVKAIANTVDDLFASLGFTRTFREQIPNLQNQKIYRMVLRYQAVIDKDFWIYQSV